MSRSGYSDYCYGWELIRWRGAVNQAIRGKRGQQFLRDLVTALDALPVKRLIDGELEDASGVCALGSVGRLRGLPMENVDAYDREVVAHLFGIAPALAAEIMYENDRWEWPHQSPEDRWVSVREWAVGNIKELAP